MESFVLVFVRWFLALVVEAEKDKESSSVGWEWVRGHSRIRVHFALETCAL